MINFKALSLCFALFICTARGDLVDLDELPAPGHSGKSCEQLLQHYASTSAEFTYCAVKYARPIRICEQCVTLYRNVIKAHKDILQVEDGSGNKKCKEKLMNLDRLEVIEEGFRYITDLWDRASCSYCFESNNETLPLKNETKVFLDVLNVTLTCFSNYNLGNDTYNKSVCVDCEKTYCDMNKFYDGLKNTQVNICMDIVDSMNITRMLWNDKLKCKTEIPKLDIIYLASSCVFAALPILFYLSARLFSTAIRSRLQMQKRLAEILRPSTSSEPS